MRQAAKEMRAYYLALREAGFTDEEAFALVLTLVHTHRHQE